METQSNIDDFLAKLHPTFAKKVKRASEVETVRLPLISKNLTKDLGGGIAKGRICLIHGDTSAGKTAVCLQSIAQWQEQGLVCGFIDVEGTFDREWATRLGVDCDSLILTQTTKSSGRIEKEIVPLLKAGIDVLVVDSISDIMPETFTDDEGDLKDQENRKQIGAHAKAIGELIKAIHYHNNTTAVVLISQNTSKFGQSYVEQVPHGGNKSQFNSSQIIRLMSSASPSNQITGKVNVDGIVTDKPVGRKVTYYVKKNKLGPPFGTGEWKFYFDGDFVGVDAAHELLLMALHLGIVKKASTWYYYRDEKIQGEKTFTTRLRSEPDLWDQMVKDVENGAIDED